MKENGSIFKNLQAIKVLMLSLAMLVFLSVQGFAQDKTLKGKITDATGAPVIGAAVMIYGTQKGVVTDLDGNYTIQVSQGKTLEIVSMGMKSQKIVYEGQAMLDITMEEDALKLDEAVVVGYGVQKRVSITGAVSSMDDKELMKTPSTAITSMVGSRVAGIAALNQSGQPGSDGSSLLVRGQSAKYIVDGVERSIDQIDPNEIESVSVLKDASSAAIYGLDANSVVIVTTKKGRQQKAEITYSGTYGISQNANLIEMLDGPGYAYWYNKALEMDGNDPIFTQAIVEKMKTGVDGWGNTNWYKKTFDTGYKSQHNINATGGSENLKYFASIGYLNQQGNVKNYDFDRFNLRSNIDSKIGKYLTLTLGIAGRIEKRRQPGFSANPNDWSNVPQQAIRALPYVPEYYEIDGVSYPVSTRTASSWVNPIAATEQTGYRKQNDTYIETNFTLKYDLPWVDGLSVKFMGGFDKRFQFVKSLSTPYETAIMTLPSGGDKILYQRGTDARGTNISLTESAYQYHNLTTQSSINYDKVFGKHKISAMVLAETREIKDNTIGVTGYGLDFIQLPELNFITNLTGGGSEKIPSISGASVRKRMAGFVGRINYEFDEKYLIELSTRYDGSYLFSAKAGSRWVWLPGLSLGWRMNKESWFDVPWIQNLKPRFGIGLTGTSNGFAQYQFMNLVSIGSNSVILGNSSQSMVYTSTLGNPNLTWSKCLGYNFGVDFDAWNGLLGIEADLFYKHEYDLVSSYSGSYPSSFGGYYISTANENEKDYRGFDITLKHRNSIGELNYGAKLVLSYAKRRWLHYAGDAENDPDYRKLTGKDVGVRLGFIALGLFKDQDEIDNSAVIPGNERTTQPGDIKYLDRNGDGKITYDQDMGYVGGSDYQKFQGSFNLFANWKGFDIDMVWQWGTGRSVALTGVYTASGSSGVMDNTSFTKAFYHGGNSPEFLVHNSWTPENTNADFPRLSIAPKNSNNAYSSTFWYRKGDYLRLKSVQIGYNFPKKWLEPAGVQALRLYVEGYNLLTFSELTKYNIDPESPGVNNGYYPQQRTYSLGVKLTF